MSANPAPTDLPPAVASWRDQIERLSELASPCRYLSPSRWAPMQDAAIDFCDRLGAKAHSLGWTAQELFAVHPEHGTLRVEFCGVLMISGSKAVAVEPARIVFDWGSGYRTKQGQVWGIPVWEFVTRAR